MNLLIEDGVGLMILGMGFVFLFLVILIVVTDGMSTLLNRFFPEAESIQPSTAAATLSVAEIDPQLKTVITAAVHYHRTKSK